MFFSVTIPEFTQTYQGQTLTFPGGQFQPSNGLVHLVGFIIKRDSLPRILVLSHKEDDLYPITDTIEENDEVLDHFVFENQPDYWLNYPYRMKIPILAHMTVRETIDYLKQTVPGTWKKLPVEVVDSLKKQPNLGYRPSNDYNKESLFVNYPDNGRLIHSLNNISWHRSSDVVILVFHDEPHNHIYTFQQHNRQIFIFQGSIYSRPEKHETLLFHQVLYQHSDEASPLYQRLKMLEEGMTLDRAFQIMLTGK